MRSYFTFWSPLLWMSPSPLDRAPVQEDQQPENGFKHCWQSCWSVLRDFPFRLLLYQTLLPKHLNPENKISLGKRKTQRPLLRSSSTKNLFPSIACYQARSMLAIAGVVCLQDSKLLLVWEIILLGPNILNTEKASDIVNLDRTIA